ncbi:MAG: DUF2911 domain-containing protein [Chitinophagaceae bacterium]
MKNLFITVIAACSVLFTNAQTLKTPQISTTQTIKQNFALSSIEITYSRPGVKGRKIFGGLVPYDTLWRTGANTANILTFNDTVFINGTKINPGPYGLVSIPHEKNWTLIITKQLNVTSPGTYKKDQDVVRVEAKTKELNERLEIFTMQFANIKNGSCELWLMWDKTAVSLPITANIDEAMKAQITELLKKDNRPYYNAGMYYMNNDLDLKQALVWFDKALELEPNLLRTHYQRANCLNKMGRKEEAKTAAKKGLELAKAQKDDNFLKLNETLLVELNK